MYCSLPMKESSLFRLSLSKSLFAILWYFGTWHTDTKSTASLSQGDSEAVDLCLDYTLACLPTHIVVVALFFLRIFFSASFFELLLSFSELIVIIIGHQLVFDVVDGLL